MRGNELGPGYPGPDALGKGKHSKHSENDGGNDCPGNSGPPMNFHFAVLLMECREGWKKDNHPPRLKRQFEIIGNGGFMSNQGEKLNYKRQK
jgi:hypothetical protein